MPEKPFAGVAARVEMNDDLLDSSSRTGSRDTIRRRPSSSEEEASAPIIERYYLAKEHMQRVGV